MAYLFYSALQDSLLGIYKVYGFDPAAGTWTYILSPGPAVVATYGCNEAAMQRLVDGKVYLGLYSSGGFNYPARIKWHNGSAWGEISQGTPDVGGTSVYVKALKAYSASSVLFMPFDWYDGGPVNGLFKWNGSVISKLATLTDNDGNGIEAKRIWGMAGTAENDTYFCGETNPLQRGLWKWNGSAISNVGAPSDNAAYCGVAVRGTDVYALRYNEAGSGVFKLYKGTWGGSWSLLKDLRTLNANADYGEYGHNCISIDQSNGHVWILAKDASISHTIVFRYDGATWTTWDLYSTGSGNLIHPRGIAAMSGKCMVTATLAAGAARRTCYYDGSSWSLKEMTDAGFGDIPGPVTVVDVPNLPPFLRNTDPSPLQTGVSLSPTISADILDDVAVVSSTIDAYVDGALAYDGAAATFVAPFSGSLIPTTVDGYGGYHIALSRSTPFQKSTWVVVRIVARDGASLVMDETWQFQTVMSKKLIGLQKYDVNIRYLKEYVGDQWVPFSFQPPTIDSKTDTLWVNDEDIMIPCYAIPPNLRMEHFHNGVWEYKALPAVRSVSKMVGLSYSSVYAVVDIGGLYYFIHWDGSTWSTLTGSFGVSSVPVSLSMSSDTNVWVASSLNIGSFNIYKWDGISLSGNIALSIDTTDWIAPIGVHAKSDTEVYVFASIKKPWSHFGVQVQKYNGISWTIVAEFKTVYMGNWLTTIGDAVNDNGTFWVSGTDGNGRPLVWEFKDTTIAPAYYDPAGAWYLWPLYCTPILMDGDTYVGFLSYISGVTVGDVFTNKGGSWDFLPNSTYDWFKLGVFGIGDPPPVGPFLRNPDPFPFQTGVNLSPTISADILDDVAVVSSTIDAYVDGALVYDGTTATFIAPFSGSLVPTTVDGYSGYHIALSRSTPFPLSTWVTTRMIAQDDAYMVMDETWLFQTTSVLPPVGPFLRNTNPSPFQTGVSLSPTISADILDDVAVVASTIDAYVDGVFAYNGAAAAFVVPFSGSLVPTTVDGYSGYHITLSRSTPFQPSMWVAVRMVARDKTSIVVDETWQFRTASALLRLDQGPYEITLDVEFSSPMLLSTLLDASQYLFSGGAYTRYVEPLPPGSLTPTGVRLWVERFQGEDPFTLTVSSLRDSYGDILAPESRTAQITPFQSSAFFSNTAGLVRSWHESRLMLKDSRRAYLVGARGLDAFDITNSIGRSVRWSQLLDAYGMVAACLSGAVDYTFSDVTPPFLGSRNPAPGAIGVSKNTHIYLSVADETTSVEITQLTIYLRNTNLPMGETRVFSGANGWEFPGVCGGLISVQRQRLNIHLIPKRFFNDGPVTVLVTAVDLVGNLLSTSYTFTVGGGPVVEGGFGDEAFGIDPFGA